MILLNNIAVPNVLKTVIIFSIIPSIDMTKELVCGCWGGTVYVFGLKLETAFINCVKKYCREVMHQ